MVEETRDVVAKSKRTPARRLGKPRRIPRPKDINIRVHYELRTATGRRVSRGLAVAADRYRDLGGSGTQLGEKLRADGLLPGGRRKTEGTVEDGLFAG